MVPMKKDNTKHIYVSHTGFPHPMEATVLKNQTTQEGEEVFFFKLELVLGVIWRAAG